MNRGSDQDRKTAILEIIQKDSTILDIQDRDQIYKWGQYSGLASVGIIATIFLPLILMVTKSIPRAKKLVYLRYGIVAQLSSGAIFLYSSNRMGNLVRNIDNKYFNHLNLEGIKEYRGNMWNHSAPPVNSVGPVLANINRQPFGGNVQYYQQNQQLVPLQQNKIMATQSAKANTPINPEIVDVPNNSESNKNE